METILSFTYKYLEFIVAGLGGIGMFTLLKYRKTNTHSNDLTNLIIKQKKYVDMINKRIK